jgi:hypothetical protein
LQDKKNIFTNDFTTFPHVHTYFQKIEARCPSTSKLQIGAPIGTNRHVPSKLGGLGLMLCFKRRTTTTKKKTNKQTLTIVR